MGDLPSLSRSSRRLTPTGSSFEHRSRGTSGLKTGSASVGQRNQRAITGVRIDEYGAGAIVGKNTPPPLVAVLGAVQLADAADRDDAGRGGLLVVPAAGNARGTDRGQVSQAAAAGAGRQSHAGRDKPGRFE